MEETKTREHVEGHLDAVIRGDMEAITNDFIEEMRPQVPEIARSLPSPVKSGEVRKLEVGEEEAVAEVHYVADSGEVTVRTRWREVDGRPQIFSGEPIS